MKKINLFIALLGLFCLQLNAQDRYLEPVFEEVTVTTNVVYGVNYTVLTLGDPSIGHTVAQPLRCDIYEPTGDDETARPLVIIFPSGFFLRPQENGGCIGTKNDADAVNMASRLARLGYVAAVAEYRIGWLPIAPTQAERTFGIINAAYRGVQDSRTSIRFFKKSVEEEGNPFRVDPEKIVIWGIGTAGYISFASATLDTISDTYVPKFVTPAGPMIIQAVNGDINGTILGISPGAPVPYPAGDTLSFPNHVGYSSEFQLSVNLGGALGDTSWIDPGDVPMISFHTPDDLYAPCEEGLVLVPPPVNLPVVQVFGSCRAQTLFNTEGVNAPIDAGGPYTDPISEIARSRNGGIESFYPFPTGDPLDSAPWAYSFSEDPYGVGPDVLGSNVPCPTDPTQPNMYIDTIMAYYAPRAFAVLQLGEPAAAEELIPAQEVGLKMMPNPATSQVLIQTDLEFPIRDMRLYDFSGRLLEQQTNLNNNQFRLERKSLPPGVYIVKLRIKDRVVAQKLVFN